MTLDIHNWSSSVHQEIHKIVKDEIFPIVNQVDARLQNFEIQFLKEAAKFVRDFKSLAKEADESLAKHKALELEIDRLLRAVVSQDIMSIVQSNFVVDTSNLLTDLDRTKERFENYIIKKENEYIERLQAQLGDLKGKCKDTPCVSDTLDPLSQKLENENVYEQKDTTKGTSVNTQFRKQSIFGKPPSSSRSKLYSVTSFPKSKGLPKIDETHALSKPVTSNSVPTPQESKVVKNDNVISPGMFRINPFKTYKEEKSVPNKPIKASARTNPTTVSQPHALTKKGVNSNSNGLSSTGVDNTAKTRRPQPRSNTKNDRIPSASKSSCSKNKEVEVKKPKKVGSTERLASPKPSKPRSCLRWSPTGRIFDLKGKIIDSSESESQSNCSNGDNAYSGCSKHMTGNLKLLINFVWKFLGTVRFGNDHVAAILGYGDLQWGNILITRVYFVEGLGHNLFSVGQFCDSDLEVAFRRNTCFVRNLEGVDLLKVNRTTNLYTINLYEMASASPICLMARATSTKSWLWHQRLSHLNFDTINDLAKNDLVTGLPKFKYHKEHLCPSCEQGKSKRASHPPKPVPNSKQRLHLLQIDLCGPMRIVSINEKRYILVIVDDYSRYTWVHFLISKDEAPEEIKTFLKKITVLLQAPVIIVRTDNGTKFKNQVLQEYFDSVGISHQASSARAPQQNRVVERRNCTLVEAARTIKPGISFLHVFGALCYPNNDRDDIGKLGLKGLDLIYAPSTITTQQPTERELDLLFEAMYDDYIGGQPSAAPRTVPAAQAPLVLQTPTTSTTIAGIAPTPTNSSSQATNFLNTSQDVDELVTQQHHVPNTMLHENTFVNPFATPSTSAAESSSSQYVDPSNMHTALPPNDWIANVAIRVRTFSSKGYNLRSMIGKRLMANIKAAWSAWWNFRATSTKSWLWHQRLSHLNFNTVNDLARNDLVTGLPKFKYHKEHLLEAARTMLIFSHAPLFLWAKAIATACYTQNRSIIHCRFGKTPYELINGRKPDISFLHVFGALYYPKNDREDIRKLGAKGDIGFFIGYSANSCAYRVYNQRTKKIMETINVTFDELSAMAFEQRSSKPRLQGMTSGQISSGLDLTYAPSTITTQQPTEHELDFLFEAMYDDYIGGQPSAAPRIVLTAQAPLDVNDLDTQQKHVPNAMLDENTFVNPFVTPSTSAAESSSSQYVDPSNMHMFYQPYPHEYQWTKDNPLEQVIGEPSRPVLTRNQLRSDGDMCMYALTVSTMEPKNVKEAMTDPAWIKSMQEELLYFKRLDVWELVPAPDNIKPLTLKCLFKNKHDDENTII
ncbi:retrovirus-related pol polyprotein from transposon TNT 1-94 [Tanacetum coccineum]